MSIMTVRSVVLATAIAAVLAAMAGNPASAAEATKLTGCRYETYDPEMKPRCGHEEAQLHLPDPPPPPTTPPTVIFSIQIGEGGKNDHDRDRDHDGGRMGGNGARTDRDAAGSPR